MKNQTRKPTSSRSFAHTVKGILNDLGQEFFENHVSEQFPSNLKAGFAIAKKHYQEGMEITESDLHTLVQAEFGQVTNNLDNPIVEAAADNAAESTVAEVAATDEENQSGDGAQVATDAQVQ